MAKRLNKNLVVVLTITGMVLTTAAGIILVKSLPQLSPQKFVEEAEKAAAKGDYAMACEYYQRAAGRAKNAGDLVASNDYLLKAGDQALSAGDAGKAMGLWNAVVIQDPSQMAAQEKLVSFTLEVAELSRAADWWARLQTQATKLLDAAEKANTRSYVGLHALGRALVAQSHVRESNREEGKKYLIEAANGDKSNPNYARSLALYYFLEAQSDQSGSPNPEHIKNAAAVYDAAVQNAPADAEQKAKAYLYRGQFYATSAAGVVFPNADQLALADLEEAVRLAPESEDAIIGLGAYWHNKKITAGPSAPPEQVEEYRSKAREQYEKVIRANPDSYLGYLQLADLLLQEQRYDAALAVLDQRLKRPTNREHYRGMLNRQYMLAIRELAFKTNMVMYTTLVRSAGSSEEAKRLTAAVLDRLSKIHDETLAENGQEDPSVLFMQGRLLFLQNEPHAAVKALLKAEELTPNDTPDIQKVLAALYMQIGSSGAAKESLEVVLKAFPNDQSSLILMANVKNQLQQPQQAHIAADKVLAMRPDSREALLAKRQAYLLEKNYKGAEDLNRVLNKDATTAQDTFFKAMLLRQEAMSANPPDEARLAQAAALLQDILRENPLSFGALRQLVSILSAKPEGIPEAQKALAASREALNKKLSEVAQTQPAGAQAQGMTRELINLDLMSITIDSSLNADEKLRRKEEIVRREKDPFIVALSLFHLYRSDQVNDPDKAFSQLSEAYRLKPDDAAVLEPMLQMAIERKEWKLAEEVADKAVATGVEKSGGHMYRGMIYLARDDQAGNLAAAEREFRAALVEIPEFADAYAQLGRTLLAQNRMDDAQAAYEKAYQLNPNNAFSPVGLAIIAEVEGREEDKQKWLAIASQVAPGNAWVQRNLLAQQDRRDPKKGIARREDIRKNNPKDLDNLVQLAELYTVSKDLEAADQVYRAAMEVAPTNLQLAGLYARFLAGKERADIPGAIAMLQKVVVSVNAGEADKKASAQLLYASFLRDVAAAGVVSAPPREEIDKAFLAAAEMSASMGVYSQVAGYFLDSGRSAEALKWYGQARTSAERAGNKEQRKAAHQLIVQTLLQTANPENFEVTRKEIAAYRAQYPDDAVGSMMQAELDIASGHEPQAIEQLTQYIARLPQNPLGYIKRGAAYFRRSEWEAAIKDLRQARSLDPRFMKGSGRLLLAQAYEHNRDPDAAVRELQSLTEDLPSTGEFAQQLFALYVRLKRFDSAESLINTRSQRSANAPQWEDLRRTIAMERKDYAAALRHARNAAQQSGYSPAALDSYLVLLLQLNRFDELITFVETQLPTEHRKDAVLVRQASAYLARNNTEKGIELCLQAVSTPPVDVLVLSDFFARDPHFKGYGEALQGRLEAMWQSGRRDRDLRLLLSSVRRVRGDYSAAAEALRELVKVASEDTPEKSREAVYLTRSLATICYEAKEWNEARDNYLKVLEKNSRDVVSLNNLAYLLMEQLNAPQEALAYSQRADAAVADGTFQKASVLDTLGWNLHLLGRHDEAISRLGRSLQIDARAASVRYHLAEALYQRSQKSPANIAQADLEQAKKEVKAAHELMAAAGRDAENVGERLVALAARLNVTLETPATQAAR